MKRRTFIRAASVTGVAALAGCGSTDSGGDPTPTETATTATPTGTEQPTTATPAMTDTSFTVLRNRSGGQRDEATVTTDGTTVTVEGTIWGSDGCTTARLSDVRYDAAADELTVAVATSQRETTEPTACTQAIVEIEYRATVTFDGGLPGTVVVTHDHGDGSETVTTASP